MDYSEKIFEILGVKPFEEFKIKNCDLIYRINSDLIIEYRKQKESKWIRSAYSIRQFLIGCEKIIKIIQPLTKEEQLVIDYARLCGYNWIAKDLNGECFAYKNTPKKCMREWVDSYYCTSRKLDYDLSFLSWNDKDPYYIGGEDDAE